MTIMKSNTTTTTSYTDHVDYADAPPRVYMGETDSKTGQIGALLLLWWSDNTRRMGHWPPVVW